MICNYDRMGVGCNKKTSLRSVSTNKYYSCLALNSSGVSALICSA